VGTGNSRGGAYSVWWARTKGWLFDEPPGLMSGTDSLLSRTGFTISLWNGWIPLHFSSMADRRR
jgi:hypothetical protein